MPIIVNPSNVIVEVDDVEKATELLTKNGFRQPTDVELAEYRMENKITEMDICSGLYIHPNGEKADGYGQSTKLLMQSVMEAGATITTKFKNQEIGIVFSYPHALKALETKHRVLFSMFESTKIPSEWVQYLKLADQIYVPSKFCQDAFADRGFKSEIIPLGIDHRRFYYEKTEKNDVFTFLMYNAFDQRKGWDIVFKAFTDEFQQDTNVKLILKTIKNNIPLVFPKSQYPNLEIIKGELSPDELRHLIQKSHCFVFPSRGEGFGYTPLESLACGTPAIVPNAHGIAQYFNDKYFIENEIERLRPPLYADFDISELGNMSEPSVADLRQKMRWAYEHKKDLENKGIKGSKWVKDNYTMTKTGKLLVDALAKRFGDNKVFGVRGSEKVVLQHPDDIEPRLSLIMLTYNAIDYTKRAISSILKRVASPFELIVIDNNSSDETAEYLKSIEDSRVKIVLNKENKGVAGGRNQGMLLARADIIVFVDNDIEIFDGWDNAILEDFKDKRVGVVGKSGCRVPSLKPIAFEPVAQGECDVVAGYCFAFRRKFIDIVGMQWEKFPNGKFWHEDLEYCKRVKLAGYTVIANNAIPMTHFEHKSMGDNVKGNESIKVVSGFYENAEYIAERFVDDNIIYYRRTWEGFDSWSSYDRIARGFCNAMRELGVVVVRPETIHDAPFSFDLCKGTDIIYKGKRFVSMFLENDRPPQDWSEGIARTDYVFSGSNHVYSALKKEAYSEKIFDVSPVGVETDIYNFNVKPLKDFYPDKFKFFCMGASQPRKGWWELIQWYSETFTKDDNVVLIIKDGDYGQKDITANKIRECTKRENAPEIVHIWDHWNSEYLARVYKTVSLNGVYISPHKGEGFGMPHIEAMACGCRVATTDFGGVCGNLRENGVPYSTVKFFPFTFELSTFHKNNQEKYYLPEEEPLWAVPDAKDVKGYMKAIVDEKIDQNELKSVSEKICKRFNYNSITQNYLKHLKLSTKL